MSCKKATKGGWREKKRNNKKNNKIKIDQNVATDELFHDVVSMITKERFEECLDDHMLRVFPNDTNIEWFPLDWVIIRKRQESTIKLVHASDPIALGKALL